MVSLQAKGLNRRLQNIFYPGLLDTLGEDEKVRSFDIYLSVFFRKL